MAEQKWGDISVTQSISKWCARVLAKDCIDETPRLYDEQVIYFPCRSWALNNEKVRGREVEGTWI